MDIPDKKLKRGLKDVSALFQETERTVAGTRHASPLPRLSKILPLVTEQQKIGLWTSQPLERPRAFDIFSGLLQKEGVSSARIKIRSETPGNRLQTAADSSALKSCTMTLEQFEIICHNGFKAVEELEENILWVDFDSECPWQAQRVMAMLHKWILMVKPDLESLSEAYRMIKKSHQVYKRADYYMISEIEDSSRAGLLYEKFSAMVSKHLGLPLSWLGWKQAGLAEDYSHVQLKMLLAQNISL